MTDSTPTEAAEKSLAITDTLPKLVNCVSGSESHLAEWRDGPEAHRRLIDVELDRVMQVIHLAPILARAVRAQRKFPIMSESLGRGKHRTHAAIPWVLAERAYAAYVARFGHCQTLERLAERGGFSCGEMDRLAPGWEEECKEVTRLTAERDTALERCKELELREAALFGKQEGIERCKECGITPEVVAERVSAQYQYRKEWEAHAADLQAQLDRATQPRTIDVEKT